MLEFSNSVEGCVTRGTGEPPVIENGVMRETPDTPAHLNYQTVPELCVNECGERPDLISLLTAFTGLLFISQPIGCVIWYYRFNV